MQTIGPILATPGFALHGTYRGLLTAGHLTNQESLSGMRTRAFFQPNLPSQASSALACLACLSRLPPTSTCLQVADVIQRRKLEKKEPRSVSLGREPSSSTQSDRDSMTTQLAVELPCIDAMIGSSWVGCRFNLSLAESEPPVVKSVVWTFWADPKLASNNSLAYGPMP